jgi:hypothetical protein
MEAADWERFMAKVEIQENGCWLWKGYIKQNGYGQFGFNGKQYECHRLILQEKLGRPIHKKLDTRHLCGVSACCSPDHLAESTRKENLSDMKIHGTAPIGEKNGNAKLTENEIRAIRKDPRSYCQIAKSYRVSHHAISQIKQHSTWKHIV